MPFGDYTEEELKEFLEMHNAKEIVKIVIGYDILEYSELCAKKEKLVGEKIKIEQYYKKNKSYPKKYNETKYNQL